MVGRVRVEIVADGSFRLCESDGRLVHSWLPDLEADDWLPIDRGGYDEQHDAFGFALAVDLIRSEAGLIDVAPESIEAERLKLDEIKTGRPTKEPQAALDRLADRIRGKAPSLDDFAGRVLRRVDAESYPVTRHAVSEPVVEHRRIRSA